MPHKTDEDVLVRAVVQREHNQRSVNQQVQELNSRCRPDDHNECNGDLLQHVDVARNIQVPAGEASRCEVYVWQLKSRCHRGVASAMSRFVRYHSTVRRIPSAKSICAVHPKVRAARLGSMRRRG